MDVKGRVAFPARYREKLCGEDQQPIIITIDTQSRCLLVYPLSKWEVIEQEIQDLPSLNPAVRRFQRLLIGYASELQFDASGRILLPQSLRDYASLQKKLVLVGQGKKMELWDEASWLTERDKWLEESIEDAELPEELLTLSL
jgi:MraZ protein